MFIQKSFEAGKESSESIETRVKNVFEEEKRKVLSIYHTKEKKVHSNPDKRVRMLKYDEKGREEYSSNENLVDLRA